MSPSVVAHRHRESLLQWNKATAKHTTFSERHGLFKINRLMWGNMDAVEHRAFFYGAQK